MSYEKDFIMRVPDFARLQLGDTAFTATRVRRRWIIFSKVEIVIILLIHITQIFELVGDQF